MSQISVYHNPPFSWDDIETVCLDMDGTLLDLNFDNHFWLEYVPQIYASRNGIDLEQAKQELYRLFDSQKGTLNWYCLDFWSDKLELDIQSLKNDISHLIAIREGVDPFLQFLTQLNINVFLVTNAHQDAIELKMNQVQIKHYFDQIICSHDMGLAKESIQFWDQFTEMYPIDRSKTLFIDDSEAVLQSARESGIRYLFGIKKPDSQQPEKALDNFDQISHFSDMIQLSG